MTRIKPIPVEEAKDDVKAIYQNLEKKMGKVLNIFQSMANSPETLKAFLGLNEAAGQTSLSPKLREEIALAVAQANHCQYCLSAHSTHAKAIGMTPQEIISARQAESQDKKNQAILKFVHQVVENRGNVANQDVDGLKTAGVTDKELVEIILSITVNLFTNYFNLITDPKIDFPQAPELKD